MKPKKITVKKLYKNCASIRDYVVQKCIEKNQDIMIHYKDWQMLLSVNNLKEASQFHQQDFESKYCDRTYQLLDYKFIPESLK